MRLLVAGSREWRDEGAISEVLRVLRPSLVIHGAHWEGADKIAADACVRLGISQVPYPADWDKYGKPAGPIRNQVMVDTQPDLVVAFRVHGSSRGTDDLIERARKAGIVVLRYQG